MKEVYLSGGEGCLSVDEEHKQFNGIEPNDSKKIKCGRKNRWWVYTKK